MDSKKSNKITDIVRLQQILKKWKRLATNSTKNTNKNRSSCSDSNSNGSSMGCSSNNSNGSKSIKFLKKSLSFSDRSSSSSSTTSGEVIPKGFLAVCVGKDLTKRFIIPTEYLSHQVFGILLREAEEEFGFHQEGVLKIPCEVSVFEKILMMMMEEKKRDEIFSLHEFGFRINTPAATAGDHQKYILTPSSASTFYSPDSELTSRHPQICR